MTMSASQDPLDRLFQELVHAARKAGVLDHPIAVGEIIERLVPYRVVRPLRIAELHDDYLQLVMHLLAGERDLVLADPELREICQAALTTRHPDLSILKTFEDREVTLAAEAVGRVLQPAAAPADRRESEAMSISQRPSAPADLVPPTIAHVVPPRMPSATPPALPSTPTVRGRPVPSTRTGRLSRMMGGAVPIVATRSAAVQRLPSDPVSSTAVEGTEGFACLYCTRPLPGGRPARYCPWCGQHLLQRCRMCRTSLEEAWIFCITCGHPT